MFFVCTELMCNCDTVEQSAVLADLFEQTGESSKDRAGKENHHLEGRLYGIFSVLSCRLWYDSTKIILLHEIRSPQQLLSHL